MKNAILVVWAVLAVGLFVGGILRTLFFVMLAAHVIEFLFFLPTLKKAPGGLGHHFVQTLIYGMVHFQEVREAQGAERTAS